MAVKKKKTAKKTVRKKTVKKKVTRKKVARKKPVKKKAVKKKTVKRKVARKKPVKKKVVRKKTVKKKVTKKPTKRKVVRKVAKKKKGTKRRKARRAVGGFLKKNQKGIIGTLTKGAAVVAGAVGAGVAANNLPIKDPRMKAIGVVIAGALLANTKLLRGPEGQALAMGMIASGGISLLKQFAPNVPLLAGEENMYIPSEEELAMLGYDDGYEDDDYDMLGVEEDVLDDETFEGESVNLEGDDEWIDSSSF